MAVALEEFVRLIEDSGILPDDVIKDFRSRQSSVKNADELALELVRENKLTKFQVEEVAKGNGKSLTLGNYVLMEKIGAGGMGQVFKAHHRRMDRFVAIKVLPAAMTKDQAAIARFEREVKAVAKITHPNIVAAFDADCANGVHFLVMELVEGSDLSALVRKHGPLSTEKAVFYVLQAAKGLEASHAAGIVHRDIKPSNLLLDKKGTVKILDMGLARLSGDAYGAPQVELTSTGAVMGTVDYMAPEQALDTKTADARADIYSLGCSLYFLLTGRVIYDGDTVMKRLLAHREQPIPSLRAARPEVTEQLETVFRKMVAKSIEDRYQSIPQLLVDLEACCQAIQPMLALQGPVGTSNPADPLAVPSLSSSTLQKTVHAKQPASASRGRQGTKSFLLIGGLLGVVLLVGLVALLIWKSNGGQAAATTDNKNVVDSSPPPEQFSTPKSLAIPGKPATVAVPALPRGRALAQVSVEGVINFLAVNAERTLIAAAMNSHVQVFDVADRRVVLTVPNEGIIPEQMRPAFCGEHELVVRRRARLWVHNLPPNGESDSREIEVGMKSDHATSPTTGLIALANDGSMSVGRLRADDGRTWDNWADFPAAKCPSRYSLSENGEVLAWSDGFGICVVRLRGQSADELRGAQPFRLSPDHVAGVMVQLSPKGSYLAAAVMDDLLIWDVRTVEPNSPPFLTLRVFPDRKNIRTIAFSPDERRLAVGGDPSLGRAAARVYDLAGREWLADLSQTGGDYGVRAIAFLTDDQIVLGGEGQKLEFVTIGDAAGE